MNKLMKIPHKYKLHISLSLIGIALLAILPFGACRQWAVDKKQFSISSCAAFDMTSNGAQISWASYKAGTSQVEYGTTSQYGSETNEDMTPKISHLVIISGLSPSTKYYYKVKTTVPATDTADAENLEHTGSFTTAP